MKPASGSALLALVLSLSGLAAPSAASPDPSSLSRPQRTAAGIKVWVMLKDKGPAARPAAPAPGSPASLAYENLPLYAPYLDSLKAAGFSPAARLKWQNRVSGRIDEARLEALRRLPFVAGVSRMLRKARPTPLPLPVGMPWKPGALGKRAGDGIGDIDYGAETALVESLKVSKVHRWLAGTGKSPGQGVRIAVIDADFHLGSTAYADMKTRIRDQWDFVEDKPGAVTNQLLPSHGAQCMSLIGGNLPGTMVGMAPAADFLLYRAEDDGGETYAEEDFVAAAIERAVDSGAQVMSISLGYRYDFDGAPDHPQSLFDGETLPASVAALGAARRDVLLSISMGNEGGFATPANPATLSTPADADSILGVGIADSLGMRCGYSSTGPSADGRIKPDIVSMGVHRCNVVVASAAVSGTVESGSGTSYAAPAIAGVAALLRQLRPEASAQEVRRAMLATARRRGQPDNEVGYGVADAAAAARALDVPLDPPLVKSGLSRIYHWGGIGPLILDWEPGTPKPALQLLDLSGRLIPVSVTAFGTQLYVQPDHPLQTGIYIARVR